MTFGVLSSHHSRYLRLVRSETLGQSACGLTKLKIVGLLVFVYNDAVLSYHR